MLNAQADALLIELVGLVGGFVPEDPVGKFFAVVGKYFLDLERKTLCDEFLELTGILSGLRLPKLDTDNSASSQSCDAIQLAYPTG